MQEEYPEQTPANTAEKALGQYGNKRNIENEFKKPATKREELSTKAAQLKVDFENCPVQASLGTLGRKWSLLILRNIALFEKHRFNEMLKVTPGLSKRVLSMKLRELEQEGFIKIAERGTKYTRWELTEKGKDALPILMTLVQFGSKWYAEQVFEDGRPRALREVFDEYYIREIMRSLVTVPVPQYVREKILNNAILIE